MKERPPVLFFGLNKESTQAFHECTKLRNLGIDVYLAGSLDEKDKPEIQYLGRSWEGLEEIRELVTVLCLKKLESVYASEIVLRRLIEGGKVQTPDDELFQELKPYLQQLGLNRNLSYCPNPYSCEEYDICGKEHCDNPYALLKRGSLTHYLNKVRLLKHTGICSSAPEYITMIMNMEHGNEK